jgi:hypothetical protein
MSCEFPNCFAPDGYPDHIHPTGLADEYLPREKSEPKFFCVSIYMVDRAYGGPEEGGWWYNCGAPVLALGKFTRCFETYQEAMVYRDDLVVHQLPLLNKGRRPISSVLSEGRYDVVIDEDEYPTPFPKERPYYC